MLKCYVQRPRGGSAGYGEGDAVGAPETPSGPCYVPSPGSFESTVTTELTLSALVFRLSRVADGVRGGERWRKAGERARRRTYSLSLRRTAHPDCVVTTTHGTSASLVTVGQTRRPQFPR